jgi:hypothetical protein
MAYWANFTRHRRASTLKAASFASNHHSVEHCRCRAVGQLRKRLGRRWAAGFMHAEYMTQSPHHSRTAQVALERMRALC